jgi:hypothetical protein
MATLRESRPQQSTASQITDAVFLLALVFVTLFVTTFVFADDGASVTGETQVTAIEDLPLPAAEKRQFLEMEDAGMVDAETVAAAVEANAPSEDKYSFNALGLLGTVLLALAYLAFVYRTSFKEYREVVRARFGPPERSSL